MGRTVAMAHVTISTLHTETPSVEKRNPSGPHQARERGTNPLMATIERSSSSWSSEWATGTAFFDLTSMTDKVPSPLQVWVGTRVLSLLLLQ